MKVLKISVQEEKDAISKAIKKLQNDLIDIYDKFPSPNEDLFNFVDTELMKVNYSVLRFKTGLEYHYAGIDEQ